ncbi:hypothetical protein WA026_020772 [Henosepilachna vigintioctopunctata]|uniref:peptidylprolyl isomerase n=1 Tax=Henosepilachna vigintioctopunctata TaxID=420089 RepID=A0AAW1TXF9_9CUCU
MPAVDISPQQNKGVLKEIVKEGIGNDIPPHGCTVQVHYTGTLLDGTKFDSSRDRGQPFEFSLGKGSVIKAWDIGIATMKTGEHSILTCAPEFAYGKSGSPPTIPPNSTLLFDVELLGWKGEDLSRKKDGSIERITITPGEGFSTPNDGSLVEVHIVGKLGDNVLEDRDVLFYLGEGSEENILKGVEIALEKFKKGETSKLKIHSKHATGNDNLNLSNIPKDSYLEYVVTLKNFEACKESWALDYEEKVKQAKLFKEKGTNYFNQQKYDLALKMYKKVVEYLAKEDPVQMNEEGSSVLLSAYLNQSLCYLKTQDYYSARSSASEALLMSPNNEKAFFRRGKANLELGEPELASGDFMQCLKINPNNAAAKTKCALCRKKVKEQFESMKKVYSNMFDKFVKMDTQREEIELKNQPNIMSSVGEWGAEDREREPSEFERENPDILLLNKTGEFKDM